MSPFRLLDDTPPRPIAAWTPMGAGLAAAVCIALQIGRIPARPMLSWKALFILAVASVGSVFVCSLAVARITYRLLPSQAAIDTRYTAMSTAASAVWLAPLAILLADESLWALPASVILAVRLVRLFRYHARALDQDAGAWIQHGWPFGSQRQLQCALGASLCLQAGLAAIMAGHVAVAAALVAIGSAALAFRPMTTPSRPPTRRAWLVVFAAILLMCGPLARRLEYPRGAGSGKPSRFGVAYAARALLLGLFPGEQAEAVTKPSRQIRSPSTVLVIGGAYPGVILWPETKPVTTLIPPLPVFGPNLVSVRREQSLSIPFFGVYWLFQSPHRSPPENSITVRGSPAAQTYRSIDRRPLFMEAHQNFGTLIDVKCCRGIQVVIRKADRHPGPVALELVLVNTILPGRPSQSLGSLPVAPSSVLVEETLTFNMPSVAKIPGFDEIAVRFRLESLRADRSAKIAIERFVFVLPLIQPMTVR